MVIGAPLRLWRTVAWIICVQRHRPGARHRRRRGIADRAAQYHGGVDHLLSFYQLPQRGGVLHRQPNATVRHGTAEIAQLEGAMDGVAGLGEENRVGNRRIVPFLAVMIDFHAEGRKCAAVMRWVDLSILIRRPAWAAWLRISTATMAAVSGVMRRLISIAKHSSPRCSVETRHATCLADATASSRADHLF